MDHRDDIYRHYYSDSNDAGFREMPDETSLDDHRVSYQGSYNTAHMDNMYRNQAFNGYDSSLTCPDTSVMEFSNARNSASIQCGVHAFPQHSSSFSGTQEKPDEVQWFPSIAPHDWYDDGTMGMSSTTALFAAATAALVPLSCYRNTPDSTHEDHMADDPHNGYHQYRHPGETFAMHQTSDLTSFHEREPYAPSWPTAMHRTATEPSADTFSLSAVVFCTACGLLSHSNRRSRSQKPLVLIGVGITLAVTAFHTGGDRLPWNTTVPVAVLIALLLSRILDTICRCLRASAASSEK